MGKTMFLHQVIVSSFSGYSRSDQRLETGWTVGLVQAYLCSITITGFRRFWW